MSGRTQMDPVQFSGRIISDINWIFESAKDVSSDERFYLLAAILQWQGGRSYGLDQSVRANLETCCGSWCRETQSELYGRLDSIRKKFVDLFRLGRRNILNYTALSYWGPMLREDSRRSVFRRWPYGSEAETKRGLASAICFYDLTFAGIALRPEQQLFSVTQYTATKAPNLPGIDVVYLRERENSSRLATKGFWPINGDICEDLLKILGWNLWIDEIAQLAESDLESILRYSLDQAEPESRIRGIRSRIQEEALKHVENFSSHMSSLSKKLLAEVDRSQQYLDQAFDGGNCASRFPIDLTRACFMLATHLLWRSACPSDFTYTFTVPLLGPLYLNTACTLTVGTDWPIRPGRRLMISNIAWAFISNPLIQDYATRLENAERDKYFKASTRLLGHNVPNLAIAPCITQLMQIENTVESALAPHDDSLLPVDFPEILRNIRKRSMMSRDLFEHYERLLTYALGAKGVVDMFRPKRRHLDDFRRENQEMDLGSQTFALTELLHPLKRLLDLHKEKYAVGRQRRKELSEKFAIEWETQWAAQGPTKVRPEDVQIREQRSLLREVLFNLVSNALNNIGDPLLENDRGVVKVVMVVSDQSLQIDVIDRGNGFGSERISRQTEISEILRSVDEGGLDKVVSGLLVQKARRGGLEGLGLIFVAAYVRSREWFPDKKGPECKKIGLVIDPEDAYPDHIGAVVRLVIPLSESRLRLQSSGDGMLR